MSEGVLPLDDEARRSSRASSWTTNGSDMVVKVIRFGFACHCMRDFNLLRSDETTTFPAVLNVRHAMVNRSRDWFTSSLGSRSTLSHHAGVTGTRAWKLVKTGEFDKRQVKKRCSAVPRHQQAHDRSERCAETNWCSGSYECYMVSQGQAQNSPRGLAVPGSLASKEWTKQHHPASRTLCTKSDAVPLTQCLVRCRVCVQENHMVATSSVRPKPMSDSTKQN